MTSSTNEFELAPLGLKTRGTLVFLVFAILLTCVGLITGTAAIFAATLVVEPTQLTIQGLFSDDVWSRDELNTRKARAANWDHEPGLRPGSAHQSKRRRNPSFVFGTEVLEGGRKAYFVATFANVVVIPKRDKEMIIFSTEAADDAAATIRAGGFGTYPLTRPNVVVVAAVFGLCLSLLGGICWSILRSFRTARRVRLSVSPSGLEVRDGRNVVQIPHSTLVLENARLVNLNTTPSLLGKRLVAGTATVGLLSGRMVLKNGKEAVVQVTAKQCALYLPTAKGPSLVVSVTDPDGLLRALSQYSVRPPVMASGSS